MGIKNIKIKEQRGSVSLFSLLILLLITIIGLKLISKKMDYISKHKSLIKNYLCSKEFNGVTGEHIGRLEKLNIAIKGLNTTGLIAMVIPGGAFITGSSIRVKKVIQRVQTVFHFAYMKKLFDFTRKGCFFSPNAYKTPYKNKVYRLERNALGLAKLRSKSWNIYSIRKNHIIKSHFNYRKGGKHMRTKELWAKDSWPIL